MNGTYEFTASPSKPHVIVHHNGVIFEPKEIREIAEEVIELLKNRNLSYAKAELILLKASQLLDTETLL